MTSTLADIIAVLVTILESSIILDPGCGLCFSKYFIHKLHKTQQYILKLNMLMMTPPLPLQQTKSVYIFLFKIIHYEHRGALATHPFWRKNRYVPTDNYTVFPNYQELCELSKTSVTCLFYICWHNKETWQINSHLHIQFCSPFSPLSYWPFSKYNH